MTIVTRDAGLKECILSSPDTQQLVVEVLLGRCLPQLAAGVEAAGGGGRTRPQDSGESEGQAQLLLLSAGEEDVALGFLLKEMHSSLGGGTPYHAALQSHLEQRPDAAQAALHAAGRVVLALPCRLPAGDDAAADWLFWHLSAAGVLGTLASAVPSAPAARQAHWFELLRPVPRIAAAMPQLNVARQPGAQEGPADHAVLLYAIVLLYACRQASDLKQANSEVFSSPADAACWAAAVEATLRVLPTLVACAQQPAAGSQWAEGVPVLRECCERTLTSLRGALSSSLAHWTQRLLAAWQPAAEAAGPSPAAAAGGFEPGQLANELWQLHSTSCRALHWLAADRRRLASVNLQDSPRNWQFLLDALCSQLLACHVQMQRAWGGSRGGLMGSLRPANPDEQEG